jgi:hypothetical protein
MNVKKKPNDLAVRGPMAHACGTREAFREGHPNVLAKKRSELAGWHEPIEPRRLRQH